MSKLFLYFTVNSVKYLKLHPQQQQRFYPRGWNHRRPRHVYSLNEFEEIENVKNKQNSAQVETKKQEQDDRATESSIKIDWNKSRKSTFENLDFKVKKNQNINYRIQEKPLVATHQVSKNNVKTKKVTTDMLETVIDKDGNYIYTKMGNNDPRVGLILAELKSKKEKKEKDWILLEGKRLIRDAILANCRLKYLLFSRKDDVESMKSFLPKMGAQLYKMPYKEMQYWSDLTTCPGIMGIFKIPDISNYTPKNSIPLTVICDNIREPGNLGAILRICAGVGCKKVILTKGCANIWEGKVLRSAMGAHFKLKIERNIEWDKLELEENSQICIADNRVVSSEESLNESEIDNDVVNLPLVPYYAIDYNRLGHIVLIVGGETLGISEKAYEFASKKSGSRLNIPLNNEVESLNVGTALGIITFEIKRQLNKKY